MNADARLLQLERRWMRCLRLSPLAREDRAFCVGDLMVRIEDAIECTPAEGPKGIAVKLRLLRFIAEGNELNPKAFDKVLSDIDRMTRGAAP